MSNISSSLAGLSLLSGTNAFSTFADAAGTIDSRAVRDAKALFTTPTTTPPWKEAASTTPISTQVSTITWMATIIDKALTGSAALPTDVQTAFTTYKALDRLRLLAETAATATTSSTERASLQAAFAKGLTDLQTYLGTAPSDKLQLSFAQPARRVETVAVKAPATLAATEVPGKGVMTARDGALPGMTGTEKFRITLSRGSTTDIVDVDLAGTAQPPTLDSVAGAINAAIAAVPMRNADGTVALDADGNAVPRWTTKFVPEKKDGFWGLALQRGTETVSIDQIGAGDALMVASGVSSSSMPVAARVLRFDDPAGALSRQTLATVSAIDTAATERAKLLASSASPTGTTVAAADVRAATTARAVATDANGFTYVVGTASGDLGSNKSDGGNDLFLTKLDSEGNVAWQRSLGAAGTAEGAAIAIAPDGGIIVAGTVTGKFDGTTSDGDMMVARFDANGDESFARLVRSGGADVANAVTVGADGSIFVAGTSASGGGDAFIARLDAKGQLQQRRTIDSGGTDTVTALAIGSDGSLLALTRENGEARLHRLDPAQLSTDLGQISLGIADARAIAVDASGNIAIGGSTLAAVPGDQVNGMGGGRDGFVARIDAALSGASVTYFGTAGEDQIDSVAFMGGALYAGGRTTGALGGERTGAVDGFVSRIDATTGVVEATSQFGQPTMKSEPVRVAAATGGDTVLGALGLHRGTITPADSAKLTAQTSLRVGDEFSIRVDGGALRKITIGKDDTITTLAQRVRLLTGTNALVTTTTTNGATSLRIEAKPGVEIELVAGGDGKDALAKLGLPAMRIATPETVAKNAPSVRPGGSYGLDLTTALDISSAKGAALALARIKSALSVSQTGYRSLYWDDAKAALANGGTSTSGSSTSREAAQLAQYQAALTRLTSSSSTSLIGF